MKPFWNEREKDTETERFVGKSELIWDGKIKSFKEADTSCEKTLLTINFTEFSAFISQNWLACLINLIEYVKPCFIVIRI